MKRSEHKCAVESCENACPRLFPFCVGCWRRVPEKLQVGVRHELDKRGTSDLDRAALYFAVTTAAASVTEAEVTPGAERWEKLWVEHGSPELAVVG